MIGTGCLKFGVRTSRLLILSEVLFVSSKLQIWQRREILKIYPKRNLMQAEIVFKKQILSVKQENRLSES
jgi:hypothetical protein